MLNIWDSEIIYEKHYPKVEISDILENLEKDDSSFDGKMPSFESIVAHAEQERSQKELPEKLKLIEGAIATAKELSESFQIDTTITKKLGYVSITLEFDCCPFIGDMHEMFAKILFLADDCSFFHIPKSGFDITLSMGFNTYK